MNLDRKKISSEQIQAKQNFDAILSNYKLLKKPFYKSKWFWGATGLATVSLTVVLVLSNLNNNKNVYAEHDTLTNSQPTLNNNLPEDTPCLKAIKADAVNFDVYKVMPNKGDTIKLKDGSIIVIVPGSLLAIDIQEPVKIKTRVFHDKATAFLAGIPMDIEQGAFESAGMIEIRVEQNGKEIKINPSKPLEVSLALHKPSERFNFYYLDEAKKGWEDTPCVFSDRKIDVNGVAESRKKIEEELLKIEEEIVVNNSKQTQLRAELPTREEYKLPLKKDRIFELDYSEREYPELAKLKNVNFEALPNQKNFNRVIATTWSSMNLNASGNERYTLTFSNSSAKEVLKVRPVLVGAEKDKATALFKAVNQDIQNRMVELQMQEKDLKIAETEKRVQLRGLVAGFEKNTKVVMSTNETYAPSSSIQVINNTANFNTSRTGIFNADRPINYPKPLSMPLAFVKNGNTFMARNVYVFDGKKDVRYAYGKGNKSISELGLNNGEHVLVAISSSDEVAYVKVKKSTLVAQRNAILELILIEQENLNGEFIRELLDEQAQDNLVVL